MSTYEASADEPSLRRVTDSPAGSIAGMYPVPKWAPRFLREWVLKAALQEAARNAISGFERDRTTGADPLTPKAAKGLRWCLEEPPPRQFRQEAGVVPESRTFVFGHTHKPFVDSWDANRVLNTGPLRGRHSLVQRRIVRPESRGTCPGGSRAWRPVRMEIVRGNRTDAGRTARRQLCGPPQAEGPAAPAGR